MKHNLPSFKQDSLKTNLIASESVIKMLPQQLQNKARLVAEKNHNHLLNGRVKNIPEDSLQKDHRNIVSIKRKLRLNNAIVTKADKGNTIVVINNDDYISKVTKFIQDNNIELMDKDPTSDFTKKINSAINSCQSLFKSESTRRFLKPMKPRAPTLNGLPKIHKREIPIRPVVNCRTAPGFKVAQKLERIIKAGIIHEENYSLKNTYDFINKAKTLKVSSSHKMSSLDIVNLYTNVPVDETIDILEENLLRSKVYNKKVVEDIIRLLKVVLKQNYFTFNGKIYHQKEGLAMGSPLSGLLADLYMNHFERKFIMSNDTYRKRIMFYRRYVDDTFVVFDGTIRQLESMVNEINKVHPKIKFTLEHEDGNQINFLDTTVKKEDGVLSFNVYRKPTATNTTIHSSSFHPLSHKMAAYNSLVHRAISFPLSPEDFEKEIDIIKHIAVSNGYNASIVDNLLTKHSRKPVIPRPPKEEQKYLPASFNILTSRMENFFKGHNYRLGFSTGNSMQRLLKHQSLGSTPLKDKSGVYRMECSTCDKFYIGQTGRSFGIRYKEHLPKGKLVNITSNFAKHLIDDNHDYESFEANCIPLHVCDKGRVMDTLEEYEVYKGYKLNSNNILNDKLRFNINPLYDLAMGTEVDLSRKKDSSDNLIYRTHFQNGFRPNYNIGAT